MPKDGYSSHGGALKLKGAKDARIDKKKKKKKSKPSLEEPKEVSPHADELRKDSTGADPESGDDTKQIDKEQSQKYDGKTETERRHQEMKRKRLDERLKREGVKSHKERVEELNKYLSNLSEHHDMPRIGPG
ncbi:MAG: hypothetical protein M1814_002657 [Vezdaea aestivalis]|nr:MAG: hypothetical protein M1814_002657 [Vezdaea aestivalis]